MSSRRKSVNTEKLVYLSVFTALVIVLQCLASFVFPKIAVSVNLSLIPVVLGAAFCNMWCGAWLGFLSGFIILFDPTTVAFMQFSPVATVFLVLLKGAASGLAGGLVYKLCEKKNKYLAVLLAALTTPIVNTGIFFVGCLLFFYPLIQSWAVDSSVVAFVVTGMIGTNFLVEMGLNVLLSPTVTRLINIKKK